jgi:hypothetical protein
MKSEWSREARKEKASLPIIVKWCIATTIVYIVEFPNSVWEIVASADSSIPKRCLGICCCRQLSIYQTFEIRPHDYAHILLQLAIISTTPPVNCPSLLQDDRLQACVFGLLYIVTVQHDIHCCVANVRQAIQTRYIRVA